MQAAFMKVVTKIEWKRKKNGTTDVQFSTDKNSQQRKTARHCSLQNSDEKQYCQYWILGWLFLLDFTQIEIACWSSVC